MRFGRLSRRAALFVSLLASVSSCGHEEHERDDANAQARIAAGMAKVEALQAKSDAARVEQNAANRDDDAAVGNASEMHGR